jgi:hypothetical protein
MTSDASEAVPTESSEVPAAIPYADPLVPSARETGLTSGITRGDVAALAVRIFGIYLLLNALTIAGMFVAVAFQLSRLWRRPDPQVIVYAAYLLVFGGVGAWFTLKAVRPADVSATDQAWAGVRRRARSLLQSQARFRLLAADRHCPSEEQG